MKGALQIVCVKKNSQCYYMFDSQRCWFQLIASTVVGDMFDWRGNCELSSCTESIFRPYEQSECRICLKVPCQNWQKVSSRHTTGCFLSVTWIAEYNDNFIIRYLFIREEETYLLQPDMNGSKFSQWWRDRLFQVPACQWRFGKGLTLSQREKCWPFPIWLEKCVRHAPSLAHSEHYDTCIHAASTHYILSQPMHCSTYIDPVGVI